LSSSSNSPKRAAANTTDARCMRRTDAVRDAQRLARRSARRTALVGGLVSSGGGGRRGSRSLVRYEYTSPFEYWTFHVCLLWPHTRTRTATREPMARVDRTG
jgi:hypothetical protein